MKKVIKDAGLEDKIHKYASNINTLKKDYPDFYDYYSKSFIRLIKLTDKENYYFEVESTHRELQLFKGINQECYETLMHIYANVVQVTGAKWELKEAKE